MAASVTRGQRVGNVVKWETAPDKGYCRKTMSVTVEDGMGVGALVNSSGAWVDGGVTAGSTVTGIVVDDTIYDASTGANTVTVMYQGPAIVAKNGLKFDGTAIAADYTAASTALAALGIVVEDSVS